MDRHDDWCVVICLVGEGQEKEKMRLIGNVLCWAVLFWAVIFFARVLPNTIEHGNYKIKAYQGQKIIVANNK